MAIIKSLESIKMGFISSFIIKVKNRPSLNSSWYEINQILKFIISVFNKISRHLITGVKIDLDPGGERKGRKFLVVYAIPDQCLAQAR